MLKTYNDFIFFCPLFFSPNGIPFFPKFCDKSVFLSAKTPFIYDLRSATLKRGFSNNNTCSITLAHGVSRYVCEEHISMRRENVEEINKRRWPAMIAPS